MPEPRAFKSGKDLGEEARIALVETVNCMDCGRAETDERAYDEGWQFDPPVCPDCLRWSLTDAGLACCGGVS